MPTAKGKSILEGLMPTIKWLSIKEIHITSHISSLAELSHAAPIDKNAFQLHM